MRAATPAEIDQWDELVAANPDGGQFLQTRTWGEFKSSRQWQPRYLVSEIGHTQVATLFLTRPVPGLGKLRPGELAASRLAARCLQHSADLVNDLRGPSTDGS